MPHMCVGACGSQKKGSPGGVVMGTHELPYVGAGSWIWVPGRAVSTLQHWAIFPVHLWSFYMLPKGFKKGIRRAWEMVGNIFVAEAWRLEFEFIVKASVKTRYGHHACKPITRNKGRWILGAGCPCSLLWMEGFRFNERGLSLYIHRCTHLHIERYTHAHTHTPIHKRNQENLCFSAIMTYQCLHIEYHVWL